MFFGAIGRSMLSNLFPRGWPTKNADIATQPHKTKNVHADIVGDAAEICFEKSEKSGSRKEKINF